MQRFFKLRNRKAVVGMPQLFTEIESIFDAIKDEVLLARGPLTY
jgi:hypothetical protein